MWVTVKEAAKHFGKSPKTIRKWIKESKIETQGKGVTLLVGIGETKEEAGGNTEKEDIKVARNKQRASRAEAEAKAIEAEIKLAVAKNERDKPEILIERENELNQWEKQLEELRDSIRQEKLKVEGRRTKLKSDIAEYNNRVNGLKKYRVNLEEKERVLSALEIELQTRNNKVQKTLEHRISILNGCIERYLELAEYIPEYITSIKTFQTELKGMRQAVEQYNGRTFIDSVFRNRNINIKWDEYTNRIENHLTSANDLAKLLAKSISIKTMEAK